MLTALALVVVALAALLAVAATKPDTFRVERATSIKAPPERIFALINDFHQWGGWSPWDKKDPGMKRTFTGADLGKGSAYAWDGNKNVGAGRMEITGSEPASKITIKLDFIKPFEGHNVAEFTLAPEGDMTRLSWVMHGPAPLITKIMSTFFNMDRMIGRDFEAGLANLKTLCEKPA